MGLRTSGCCIVISLSALVACNEQNGNGAAPLSAPLPELGSFGIDLSYQDSATAAGDDFFQFASGQWLNSFELPDDRSNYGAFNVLRDRSDERVVNIIEELGSKEPEALSLEGKISNWVYTKTLYDYELFNRINPGIRTKCNPPVDLEVESYFKKYT